MKATPIQRHALIYNLYSITLYYVRQTPMQSLGETVNIPLLKRPFQ